MLRTYRTCNPKVRFPKYEFNNKLLGGVTLLKVTTGVNIYIYVIKWVGHRVFDLNSHRLNALTQGCSRLMRF